MKSVAMNCDAVGEGAECHPNKTFACADKEQDDPAALSSLDEGRD